MKTVTPIIKGTRTVEYDICPHCKKEIFEKSTFVEKDYVYHRGCQDKGPIDKIKSLSPEELASKLGWNLS